MSNQSANNKRIAKNSLFMSIRMVIVLLISLYTTRVVLKVLGVEDYGIYNVVCGFVSLFAMLNTSMSNGIQRFYNFEYGKNGEEGANRVYCLSFYIQIIITIIVVALVESIGLWYLHSKMVIPADRIFAAEWIFHFSVLSFVFVILQAPYNAAIMAHERLDYFAFLGIVDAILKLGIVFLIPYLSVDKLILYGILTTSISIFNFTLSYLYCKKNFKEIHLQRIFDKQMFRSMLGFSGWNLFGSFSGMMQEQGINLVINFFFGPIVNAARGVANQINAGIESFVANITVPVRPQIVQSYAKGDSDRMMRLMFSISKLSCCFLLMMAIPVSLEINYVLQLWLGNNIPTYAAPFTIIILYSSLISNLNSATSNVVHATGKMKHYQFWGTIIKISCVPLAFLILKFHPNPNWALIAMMVCRLLGHIVGLYIVKRLVDLSIHDYCMKVILPIFLVFAISFTTSYFLHHFITNDILRLLSVIGISIISVILTLFFIALDKGEKQLVLNMSNALLVKFKIKR